MPTSRTLQLNCPDRPFHRLRSFHLAPAKPAAVAVYSQVPRSDTITPSPSPTTDKVHIQPVLPPLRRNMVIPLRGSVIATLAIMTSLFFIMSISFTFIGADSDEPFFVKTLNEISIASPGVVLVGESVDVDVDEPSVTIRWSIMACGEQFILPGSAGSHGTDACGLPASPMHLFVDSDTPATTYDPSQIPFNRDTGQRRSIQNLVQFDSDHVLDVHEVRLYPFDTYILSSTIRAASFDNQTVPIQKIVTVDITSSFDVMTIDLESYSIPGNASEEVRGRDIDMYISRPNEARFFTMAIFGVSWVLTHVTVGHVMIARRLRRNRSLLPHLVSSGAILIAMPQLRNSMPDAPGLDGVLIDSIGYFPQMVIVSISTITLLFMLVAREFDSMRNPSLSEPPIRGRQHAVAPEHHRPPRSPTVNSTSMEIAQWEMRRILKHLKGEYVFPPVKLSHHLQPSDPNKASHRRVKTMSKVLEAGEVSHWSEEE